MAHRDIKPANILLAWGDHAKLGDFGLAGQFKAPVSELEESGALMSSSVGTLLYSCPEVALVRVV